MSHYDQLTEQVEVFSLARSKYWEDLGRVLEPLIPKFREYLGVKESGWTDASGAEYPYITLGVDKGGKFVESEIYDLEPRADFRLAFILKFNLQVGQEKHMFEQVYLPMTIERKQGDYVFTIDGSSGCDNEVITLKEAQYATGNWDSLFGELTRRVAKEFEVGQFA